MKKIFTAACSVCVALALSAVCFAADAGDLYERNDDGKMVSTADSSLVPGKTYYIYLADKDADPKPTRVSVDYTCYNNETDKKFSLLGSKMSVVKRKSEDDGEYAYFAEMELKEIPIASYTYDGFTLDIEELDVSPDPISFTGEFQDGASFNVEYPEGSDITEDLQYFELDDTTDTFSVESGDAEVEINSQGVKTKVVISCNTSYDSSIGDKHMDANTSYYYFNGAKLRKTSEVRIEKGYYKYVYEKTTSGLKDITKTDDDYFVIKTATLGQYVISDKKLPSTAGSSSSSSESSSESTTPSVSTPSVSTPSVPDELPNLPGEPTGGYVPFNPGTGAAV